MSVMREQGQTDQQAIADHLKEWAAWYTCLRQISTHVVTFATWEEEEAAGEATWEIWDRICCWLEAHGVADDDILYDEVTGTARLRTA